MLRTLFMILQDAAGNAFALTKIIVGQALDGTVNALASFVAKDPSGNAQFLKTNFEGALFVSNDAGAPTNGAPISFAAGSQVKDSEEEAGIVTLEATKKYKVENTDVQLIGTRDMLWRLAWVSDNAGSPVETTIGYGFTGPGKPVSYISPSIKEFTTTGTGDQVLKLYGTALDKESDAYANVKATKLD